MKQQPILILLFVSSLCVVNVRVDVDWYAQQRIGQIALFTWLSLIFVLRRPPFFLSRACSPKMLTGVFLFISLGICSAVLAVFPLWALTEVALVCGALFIACSVAELVREEFARHSVSMILVVQGLSVFLALRALVVSAMFLVGGRAPDQQLISEGFAHSRFLGQWAIVALPIVSAPLFMRSVMSSWRISLSRLSVVGLWFLVWASGTRGAFLGVLLAALLMMTVGALRASVVRRQSYWVMLGGGVYSLVFYVAPTLLGLPVGIDDGGVVRAGMTGRMLLWSEALVMIQSHPWLGIGPMNFAGHVNRVGAHPHHAVLQIAAEWGIPAALLVLCSVCLWMRSVVRCVRRHRNQDDLVSVLRGALCFAVFSSLGQSLVDGVLVVPYTQTWLAICCGWLWAAMPARVAKTHLGLFPHWWRAVTLAALIPVGWLLYVVLRDLPNLTAMNEQYLSRYDDHLRPRFWRQGVISVLP